MEKQRMTVSCPLLWVRLSPDELDGPVMDRPRRVPVRYHRNVPCLKNEADV